MPYTPTTWTNGVTPVNQTNMSNLETQYAEAVLSYNQDFFGAGWVLTGLVASKDGTIANQLDVTAGAAYLLQSSDSTFRRRSPISSTQTTSTPTTTYYLYLQPDGSWYWSTANSPATSSLFIAQVTTDGSGNISTVTDKRTMGFTLFHAMTGAIVIPTQISVQDTVSPIQGWLTTTPVSDTVALFTSVTGDTNHRFNVYIRGSDGYGGFSAGPGGSTPATAHLYAQSTGWTITEALAIQGSGGLTLGASGVNGLVSSAQTGAANGLVFKSWNGSAGVTPFSIGGQFSSALAWVDNSGNFNGPVGGGVPVTRAGVATSVPIYTSTTTPTSPPTGSIWIKA